jgi:diamine N-acetyltransferase
MIALRPVQDDDIPAIKSWPPYPPDFAMLDYSLRDGGWLDEYYRKEGKVILVAEEDQELVGFSILSRVSGSLAEFRIALHPHKLGQGLGRTLALRTIGHGFKDPSLLTIYLVVRKNNPRAQRLYELLRFRMQGECTEVIQGKPVAFYRMEIDRDTFQGVDST